MNVEFAQGPAVRMALAVANAELRDAGCETARLDAELLLADVLGTTRTRLALDRDRELTAAESAAFAAAMARRRAREPVAYIVGRKAFRHIELRVDRRVLVPRPETELLVEAALGLPRGARVADIGTGSGAVALALKHERPDLHVIATDASEEALAVARENAERLGLEIELRHGDLTEPLGSDPLDAVVSNPPYVPERDRADLQPELDHEPAGALFAGPDGLAVLRRLIPAAARRAPFVAVEVGAGQASAVAALAGAAGLSDLQAHRDLAGIQRVVVGRR